ncbi:MAG: OmpA family protein [Bacteroidota bacterium]
MQRIALILISVFYSLGLIAQEDSVEVLIVERYPGIETAYPVNRLITDSNNYIWAATSGGLYLVTSFDQQADKVLYKNTIALAESKAGKIWAGYDQSIGEFKGTSRIYIKTRDKEVEINHLAKTGNNFWAATSNGIYVVSLTQNTIIRHYHSSNSKLPNNQVNFIHKDSDGVTWVATDNGICRIKDQNWKVYEKGAKFTAITSTKEGAWIASDKEMWLVDRQNRWYPAGVDNNLSRGTVTALAADSKGRVYIASEILVQFNPYSNKVVSFNESDGFVNTAFLTLTTDQNDNLWVGTARQGVFRIKVSQEDSNKLSALAYVVDELDCFGDADATAEVKISGGEPPYKVVWENETIEGTSVRNLPLGDYALTVTDAANQTVELLLSVQEPPSLIVELEEAHRISAPGMKDGKATVKADGGTPDYTYIWENNQMGPSARRLAEGYHRVSVTDSKGCSTYEDIEIAGASVIPELTDNPLEVGQTLQMNQLFFAADSSVITEVSHPILNEVYEFLRQNPDITIEIGGHTNNIPPDEYCFALSTARAKNVANYLYQKGIDPSQVAYHGYGKTSPIASNQTPAGRKRNQRVEIKITSMGE